jgi:hypothetical protein
MDEEPEEEKKPVADSLKRFVQDMKPVIMAIPDAKARLEAAKKFRKAVTDARSNGVNGYGAIVETIAGHKRQAMDEKQARQPISLEQMNEKACTAWNSKYKGGNV